MGNLRWHLSHCDCHQVTVTELIIWNYIRMKWHIQKHKQHFSRTPHRLFGTAETWRNAQVVSVTPTETTEYLIKISSGIRLVGGVCEKALRTKRIDEENIRRQTLFKHHLKSEDTLEIVQWELVDCDVDYCTLRGQGIGSTFASEPTHTHNHSIEFHRVGG